ELQRLSGVAVEVEVRVESRGHGLLLYLYSIDGCFLGPTLPAAAPRHAGSGASARNFGVVRVRRRREAEGKPRAPAGRAEIRSWRWTTTATSPRAWRPPTTRRRTCSTRRRWRRRPACWPSWPAAGGPW